MSGGHQLQAQQQVPNRGASKQGAGLYLVLMRIELPEVPPQQNFGRALIQCPDLQYLVAQASAPGSVDPPKQLRMEYLNLHNSLEALCCSTINCSSEPFQTLQSHKAQFDRVQ